MSSVNDNILETLITEERQFEYKKEKTEEKMKERYSLILKNDYYSLAFYGFFLDSEQEELSAHRDVRGASDILR